MQPRSKLQWRNQDVTTEEIREFEPRTVTQSIEGPLSARRYLLNRFPSTTTLGKFAADFKGLTWNREERPELLLSNE